MRESGRAARAVVDEARVDGPDAFADAPRAARAQARLVEMLDGFDASERCREVTCLYHAANWWIEQGIQDPRAFAESCAAAETPTVENRSGRDDEDAFL